MKTKNQVHRKIVRAPPGPFVILRRQNLRKLGALQITWLQAPSEIDACIFLD